MQQTFHIIVLDLFVVFLDDAAVHHEKIDRNLHRLCKKGGYIIRPNQKAAQTCHAQRVESCLNEFIAVNNVQCRRYAGHCAGNEITVIIIQSRLFRVGIILAYDIVVHQLPCSAGMLKFLAGKYNFFTVLICDSLWEQKEKR